MARKLATIQKISAINPILNSDRLEVASVLGWKVVIGKGEFKVGELIVYVEIDSLLPINLKYEFLRERCYKKNENCEGFRIKTIKLRGQISQGLILPYSILGLKGQLSEGEDITDLVGVTQYVPVIPACLTGVVKGSFPNFMPKTDETRIQVLQEVLTRHLGTCCYITEKVDGSSATYYVKDGEFGVCSRNLELKDSEGNAFWDFAKKADIENKLRSLNADIMIQGELVGPGINKNPLKLVEKKVLFFNAFNIKEYKYLNFDDFKIIIKQLELETVPIISNCFVLTDDMETLVELSKRKSLINPKVQVEGVVIRPLFEKTDLQMAQGFGNGRVSFKSINPNYLLEVDD